MPTVDGRKVDFEEAIEFFRKKTRLPTDTWTDLSEGMHARAFVVAGARDADLLADFQNAVARGLEEGTTLEKFREDFDKIVARHGWSYRGARGWRSRVIFETNMRTAYAAGQWDQIQRVKKTRPWLRYVAVLDGRTRPDHLAWHGTTLPIDDPWWDTHYPPNGWGCRCTVMQLSDEELDEFGFQPSERAPALDWQSRTINTPNGPQTLLVPKGIDAGWGYNVGKAAFGRGPTFLAQERHGPWNPLLALGGSRPSRPDRLAAVAARARLAARVREGDEAGMRDTLRRAIGGDGAVFEDPTGARVEVDQSLVDHILAGDSPWTGREAYFPLIPELIERPQEIWVGFAESAVTGKVAARRRYVRLVRLARDTVIGLVADMDGGYWSGLTFFRGNRRGLNSLRSGLRIHSSGGEE